MVSNRSAPKSKGSSKFNGVPMVKLESSDGQVLEVKRNLTRHSDLINAMFKDLKLNSSDASVTPTIPLKEVNCETLNKVLLWAEHHKEYEMKTDDDGPSDWDRNYFDAMGQKMMFDVIVAASFIEMKPLMKAGSQMLASMIRGKTTEELRDAFGLVNDFSPEEEAQIQKEMQWCYK